MSLADVPGEMFVNRSHCMILARHQRDGCVLRGPSLPIGSFFAGQGHHQGELFPETTPNDAFLTLAGHCVDGRLIKSTPVRFLSITGSLTPVPNSILVFLCKLHLATEGLVS
jgi:hypothetical protein